MTDRILRNSGALIQVTFYADGTPTDADGAVTVTVIKADGTAIATGAATTSAGAGTGTYRYSLAPQANLNHLTATWSGVFGGLAQSVQTHVEIVGSFHLAEAEARSLDARFAAAATPAITDADIRRVMAEVEDAIEAEAGVSFVRRFARETHNGRGTTTLLLDHTHPRSVLSLRTYTAAGTYTAYTVDQLGDITYDASGQIGTWTGSYAFGRANLVVEYEHGLDSPPPLIRRAARALFKTWMIEDIAAASAAGLQNVRSLSVEGYSRTFFEDVRSGDKTVDALIDEWKRSTNPAGVAIA